MIDMNKYDKGFEDCKKKVVSFLDRMEGSSGMIDKDLYRGWIRKIDKMMPKARPTS